MLCASPRNCSAKSLFNCHHAAKLSQAFRELNLFQAWQPIVYVNLGFIVALWLTLGDEKQK